MNSRVLNLVSFASAAVIGAAAISAIASRPPTDQETTASIHDGRLAGRSASVEAPGAGRPQTEE